MSHQEEYECDNCGEVCDGKYMDSRFDTPLCAECYEEESWDGVLSDYDERMEERRQMGLGNF